MTEPRRLRFKAELEQPHEILGLLLHLDVTVAQHPESTLAAHPVAGK